MRRTLQDIIVLHLADQAGQWVMGYDLEKINTKYGWIGSSGTRRCRELSEAGKHRIAGVEYMIESRKQGKYVQYRVAEKKNSGPVYDIVHMPDGRRVAVPRYG